jgi:hypothetical protein
MTLLSVLPHLLDVLGGILSNTRVVMVGANDNIPLVTAVLQISMQSAASKARP